MGWIDVVVDSYKDSEAPPKFFYWSAVAAISAVMKKQVWLNRYTYKLYPNVYVFLIARSGMKKGVPVTMARTLVSKADAARIISGRNSMQRILQDLGKAKTLEGGGIVKNAQGFLVSGELASFLVKDPDALTVLTDLHDTHAYEDYWENSLKSTGVDKLKQPCLTLLGATNEEHFTEAVPQKDVKGGFIARTFIVLSHEKGKLNSLMNAPANVPDTGYLSIYLKELAKVNGEFTVTPSAKQTYDAWYYPYMQTEVNDPTGTNNRIGDQILKVAMILSLSQSPDLEIHENHIIEAIDVCMDCATGTRQVTMGAGKSNLASQTKLVMREMLRTADHRIKKSYLLSHYFGEFTDFDLERIIQTLQSADAIHVIRQGKDEIYEMKKTALDMYNIAIGVKKP